MNPFCPTPGRVHGPHDFDYRDDGAHYAGRCDGFGTNPTMDPELSALLVEPLANEAAARTWVYAMHAIGWGTHPDDSGESIVDSATGEPAFTADEAALLDARMDEASRLLPDVYAVSCEALYAYLEGCPGSGQPVGTGSRCEACGKSFGFPHPAGLVVGRPAPMHGRNR